MTGDMVERAPGAIEIHHRGDRFLVEVGVRDGAYEVLKIRPFVGNIGAGGKSSYKPGGSIFDRSTGRMPATKLCNAICALALANTALAQSE